MKVCVFGGSGFLGSHVVDELLNRGFDVKVFDWVKGPWVPDLVEFIEGSIQDYESVKSAVEDCSVVYNFAALADLNAGILDPLKTVNINVVGGCNVLEACRSCNIDHYLFASTIYVYSREGGFYRCSKQACEQYIIEYHKAFGLDYTILRYGSIYGPRSNSTNGLYRIVKNALETGVISYSGSKEALREYVHVRDAAACAVDAYAQEIRNQSLVITGHQSIRVVDVLEMLREILDVSTEVLVDETTYKGHYSRTPYSYIPDLGKKFVPSLHVDLGQGLLELIDLVQRGIESEHR